MKLYCLRKEKYNNVNISVSFRKYVNFSIKEKEIILPASDFFIKEKDQILKNCLENKKTKLDLTGYSRYLQSLDKRFWLYLFKNIKHDYVNLITINHDIYKSMEIVFENSRKIAYEEIIQETRIK